MDLVGLLTSRTQFFAHFINYSLNEQFEKYKREGYDLIQFARNIFENIQEMWKREDYDKRQNNNIFNVFLNESITVGNMFSK